MQHAPIEIHVPAMPVLKGPTPGQAPSASFASQKSIASSTLAFPPVVSQGTIKCPGRETFEVRFYDKAESTPYGHYSTPHMLLKEAEPQKGPLSQVLFDDYVINTDPTLVAQEFAAMRKIK